MVQRIHSFMVENFGRGQALVFGGTAPIRSRRLLAPISVGEKAKKGD